MFRLGTCISVVDRDVSAYPGLLLQGCPQPGPWSGPLKKTKDARIIRANGYACSLPNYDVCGLVAEPDCVIEIRQCSGADSTNDVTDFDEIVG